MFKDYKPSMKQLPKILLAIYLVTLLWLVLFKFSLHPGSVIANYHVRVVNLIPFAGAPTQKIAEQRFYTTCSPLFRLESS